MILNNFVLKIVTNTFKDNVASIKLLEKNRFILVEENEVILDNTTKIKCNYKLTKPMYLKK